jgi:hypothetical protein
MRAVRNGACASDRIFVSLLNPEVSTLPSSRTLPFPPLVADATTTCRVRSEVVEDRRDGDGVAASATATPRARRRGANARREVGDDDATRVVVVVVAAAAVAMGAAYIVRVARE